MTYCIVGIRDGHCTLEVLGEMDMNFQIMYKTDVSRKLLRPCSLPAFLSVTPHSLSAPLPFNDRGNVP